ncbi:MBL fold metallo-hydrolase [Halosquirtibacter xylanolyticus]|uniref:MBL fold metallo-hydrolase n=1 Tax=Halosquirtibacter xylanolyticus TaxID=3374599 RepID=UPI0037494A3C|nr:MBL fold metallo-hydrolase [Prolixibacteraceae bacterium]
MKQMIYCIICYSFLFTSCGPQFGGIRSKKKRHPYDYSPNFKDGAFQNTNPIDMTMDFNFRDFRKGIGNMISPDEITKPQHDIHTHHIDSTALVQNKNGHHVYWLGHSTLLLHLDDKFILIDPIFSEVPSPYSWLGTKRFSEALPINIENLPPIDYVVISHDHYDHLDYKSIKKLKDKVKHFYTPLGVGQHLLRWGVDDNKITEMDWWEEGSSEDMSFTCLPSQHFSGRKLSTSNTTLWASWRIKSPTQNIFFSGDGGYADHFKSIGKKYGPFDIAFVECGQYNKQWPQTHMFPEQSVQASLDVKAKRVIPIHWGAFRLSTHPWTDPVTRFSKEAKRRKLEYIIPHIGQPVSLDPTEPFEIEEWWKEVE